MKGVIRLGLLPNPLPVIGQGYVIQPPARPAVVSAGLIDSLENQLHLIRQPLGIKLPPETRRNRGMPR